MRYLLMALGLRSLGVLFIGWIAVFLMSKKSASAKNLVWRGVFIGLVSLPLLFVKLPTWEVTPDQAPEVYQAVRYVKPLETLADPKPLPPRLGFISRAETIETVKANETPAWETYGFVLWILASILSTIPLLIGLFNLLRTLRKSQFQSLPLFESLCAELGVRKSVRLLSSPDLSTPSTAGWLRPVVILPASATTWESGRLEMVLRHELGHVVRSDWLFRIASHVVCIAYAPNPLVWWAANRLRAESETACDDLVLAGGINPADYARELLAIARGFRRSYVSVAVIGMAHRSSVESRLRAIVDKQRARGTASTRSIVTLAVCLVIGAGLAASFRLVRVQYTHRKPLTLAEQQAQFALRDDVSDHPVVLPVAKGAKLTVEPYQPPANHVVVSQGGVAKLPNGVTVKLNGIAPSDTLTPVWNFDNKTIESPSIGRNFSSVSFSGSGDYVAGVDRTLLCSLISDRSRQATTASYIVYPEPKSFHANRITWGQFGRGLPKNKLPINGSTLGNFNLWIPRQYATNTATYRIGVATGEWRSVMDVRNPFHEVSKLRDGAVLLNGILSIIGPADHKANLEPMSPPIQVAEAGHRPESGNLSDFRFAGRVAGSDLVERRALILDANGDLIRGEPSYVQGYYPLNGKDLHRCTHVVIQEREFYWAEFRGIPLRPRLEQDAMAAQGTTWTGSAEGIAPTYQKTIPGLGTVAIKSVSIARKEGEAWTFNGQPQWRADGKVLRFAKVAYGSGIPSILVPDGEPTEIELAYQGSAWHSAGVKLGTSETILGSRPNADSEFEVIRDRVDLKVNGNTKEGSLSLEVADGPWQVLDSKPIHINQLPDLSGRDSMNLRTGLAIVGDSKPRLIFVGAPTALETLINFTGEKLNDLPFHYAHRFVAILKDGSEQVIRPNWQFGCLIPARHGEDPNYLGWLASDVKEIRSEVRRTTKTITFDHIALRPSP